MSAHFLIRFAGITLGNLAAIVITVVAACFRISSANWLDWNQLGIMFLTFGGVNAMGFAMSMFRRAKNERVRMSEVNLTLFATLFFMYLGGRAMYTEKNMTEATLVTNGLPSDVASFGTTNIPSAVASLRIQAFFELALAWSGFLLYLWVANAYALYAAMRGVENSYAPVKSGGAEATETRHKKKRVEEDEEDNDY